MFIDDIVALTKKQEKKVTQEDERREQELVLQERTVQALERIAAALEALAGLPSPLLRSYAETRKSAAAINDVKKG